MNKDIYNCIKSTHLEKLSDTGDIIQFIHEMRAAYYEFLRLSNLKDETDNKQAFYDYCWEFNDKVYYKSKEFKSLYRLETLYDQDKFYQQNAIKCGAAMIDDTETFMLLSQGFQSDIWTVPIGKQNSLQESAYACMAREVREETGYKVPENGDTPFYTTEIVRVFLVKNVDVGADYRPEVQYEISKLARFSIPYLCSDKMKSDEMEKHFCMVLDIARQVKEKVKPSQNPYTDKPEELPILKSMEFDVLGNLLPDGVKWQEEFGIET